MTYFSHLPQLLELVLLFLFLPVGVTLAQILIVVVVRTLLVEELAILVDLQKLPAVVSFVEPHLLAYLVLSIL